MHADVVSLMTTGVVVQAALMLVAWTLDSGYSIQVEQKGARIYLLWQ
jgi:hypothetical protein